MCATQLVQTTNVDPVAAGESASRLSGVECRNNLGFLLWRQFVRLLVPLVGLVVKVPPDAAIQDQTDQRIRHTESRGDGRLRLATSCGTKDSPDLPLGQFRLVVLLASSGASMSNSICNVPGANVPSEVVHRVVRWISIVMATLHAGRAWPDEDREDEATQIGTSVVYAHDNRAAYDVTRSRHPSPLSSHFPMRTAAPLREQLTAWRDQISGSIRHRHRVVWNHHQPVYQPLTFSVETINGEG